MMKVPRISGFEAMKAFGRVGYVIIRQRGSHVVMFCTGRLGLSVPQHRELDRGTLLSLIKRAGLSVEDFLRLL
ncbi:type II toxin-antitoxin system HicA family toxin [Candidatus Woesearchaeota archaeon]|nr:type II toxin-antitoxin system HicA family toxin [Candidatus Woesearchaeota archaeon]